MKWTTTKTYKHLNTSKSSSKNLDPQTFCNCLARNYLAIALAKENPREQVQLFVTEYSGKPLSKQFLDDTQDYSETFEIIENSCHANPKYIYPKDQYIDDAIN